MSELEDKLNTLLNDPDAMAQVMALAQSLSGGAAAGGGNTGEAAQHAAASDTPGNPQVPPAAGQEAELLRELLPLLQKLRGEQSEATALLYALRPFLREERRGKVERAAFYARLLHLARTMLTQEAHGV